MRGHHTCLATTVAKCGLKTGMPVQQESSAEEKNKPQENNSMVAETGVLMFSTMKNVNETDQYTLYDLRNFKDFLYFISLVFNFQIFMRQQLEQITVY